MSDLSNTTHSWSLIVFYYGCIRLRGGCVHCYKFAPAETLDHGIENHALIAVGFVTVVYLLLTWLKNKFDELSDGSVSDTSFLALNRNLPQRAMYQAILQV